ncbi:MAG: YdeI/OmpD-associated family protein [Gemmatimonadetes bacterium]|nr:YdeI/OmpD-associated family protein [Gemmatimonadota bacterium]
MKASGDATYFRSAAAFRRWLAKHHATATELLVGYHKKGTGVSSMTWPESVDEALCYGWIDGVRRRVDEARYSIRFTPRRAKSIWSAVNIARVKVLTREGRIRPAGLAAYERRDEKRSAIYAYESVKRATLTPAQRRLLKRSRQAWTFWEAQPPSYRQRCSHWVTTAKQESTRERRLARLITACEVGKRII